MSARTATLRIRSNDPLGVTERTLASTTPDPTFVRKIGLGQMFGITEFGDLSNPPRKYRELHHGTGGWYREINPTTLFLYASARNLVQFDAVGAKVAQLQAFDRRQSGGGSVAVDTMEAFVPFNAEFQAPFSPNWIRQKRRKYFETVNVNSGAGEIAPLLFRGTLQVKDQGAGYAMEIRIVNVAWAGTHWTADIVFERLHFFASFSGSWVLGVAMASGNASPGSLPTEILLVEGTTGAQQGVGQIDTRSIAIPPDASLLVFCNLWSTVPPFTWLPVEAVEGSGVGQLDAGVTPWFYFPAVPADLATPNYEERLGVEDTIEDALDRAIGTTQDVDRTAEVASLTGGTSAESHTAIDVDAKVVHATQPVVGLTAGRRYRATLHLVSRDIPSGGDPDPVQTESTITSEFDAIADTHSLPYSYQAEVGRQQWLKYVSFEDIGAAPAPVPVVPHESETMVWYGKVLAAGGTIAADTLAILDALVAAGKVQSWWAKVRYFLPFMGADLDAALTPLIDAGPFGRPTNVSFVDGDYSEATGLQGNGTSKILTLGFTPRGLNDSSNWGGGCWVLTEHGAGNPSSGGALFGMANNPGGGTRNYELYDNPLSPYRAFSAGTFATAATIASAAAGFIYGIRKGDADRRLFGDGLLLDTDATNEAASGDTAANLRAMGTDNTNVAVPQIRYWGGRAGCFIFTNGTVTDPEVVSIYETLRDYLMTPTGRI